MSEEKHSKVEETLAHQEQQILDLSDMVSRQWDEIDLLKTQLQRLKSKVGTLEDNIPDSDGAGLSVSEIAARDKPPHY